MIRNLFVAIFFFFGPALLMFMMRNIVLLTLLWLKKKQKEAHEHPEVIDITPIHKQRHPNWFIIVVVIISLFCAVSVFIQLQKADDVAQHQYVPAYTDEAGNIVPGDWKPVGPPPPPDQ